MRSITRKKILSALIIGVMAILLMPVLVSAATIKTDLWGGVQPPSNVGVGSDPRTIIQSVIGFLMGLEISGALTSVDIIGSGERPPTPCDRKEFVLKSHHVCRPHG